MMEVLSFSFEENPEWRDASSVPPTSRMVAEITEWRRAYDALPEGAAAKQFCSRHFAQAAAVDYVHTSNVGEMVGTQSKKETEEVLKTITERDSSRLQSVLSGTSSRCEIETVNTYKAMQEFNKKHESMDYSGLLTVQEICDVHRVLLGGLHPECGKLRTREAYTHWHGGAHFYPTPKQAELIFYALIDRHNVHMASCSLDRSTDDYTRYVFKHAAELLFKFVDVHPFCDGNGRMCRLLANYTVGVITPFPVALYQNPERDGREDYLKAIVRCRENAQEGPRDLAAMLVEGAWRGWRNLEKYQTKVSVD